MRIGRGPDNCIHFECDKSISRNHCEIYILTDGVHVKDLGSKFGTFICDATSSDNVIRISSEFQTKMLPGQKLHLGAQGTNIEFFHQKLTFCLTRMEKMDKERLKRNAKLIGARCVDVVEEATHLFSNKFSAVNGIEFICPRVTIDVLDCQDVDSCCSAETDRHL